MNNQELASEEQRKSYFTWANLFKFVLAVLILCLICYLLKEYVFMKHIKIGVSSESPLHLEPLTLNK